MNVTQLSAEQVNEIADRARRIETRMHRLCEHTGVPVEAVGSTPYVHQTTEEQIYHMHNRMRRIETSLHKLLEHVGMQTREAPDKVVVDGTAQKIKVLGYDVTLAAIKAALVTAGKYQESVPFFVEANGIEIADLIFTQST